MNKLTKRLVFSGRFPNPRDLSNDTPVVIDGIELSVDILLEAYYLGYYPKPDTGKGCIEWWCPEPRTVLFPKEFKASRSLKKSIRNRGYEVSINLNFDGVIRHCAERSPVKHHILQTSSGESEARLLRLLRRYRQLGEIKFEPHGNGKVSVEFKSRQSCIDLLGPMPTWITPEIVHAYGYLQQLGYAHSVETTCHSRLVGGLYGVSLGGMFFGESMFSHETDASKVALYRLTEHLDATGFDLIDCQEPTQHLMSLGARQISRNEFLDLLERSIHRIMPESVWQRQYLLTRQSSN